MNLAYHAIDRSRREVTGALDAAGPEQAVETLRQQGLFVTKVHNAAAARRPSAHNGTLKTRQINNALRSYWWVLPVLMGALVGFVAISMFMPLFYIAATAGGG